MNKATLISLSTIGIMAVGLSTAKPTQAFWPFDLFKKDETGTTQPTPFQTLIERLAQKFNLNSADVQTVFDEVRTEKQTARREQMQSTWEEKLAQAVTDGKITEEQKQLILAKHTEVQAKLLDWQNLTFEERKTKLEELRNELKTWAEENNIPEPFQLMAGLGYGRGNGMGPNFDNDNDDDRGRGEGMRMGRGIGHGMWR